MYNLAECVPGGGAWLEAVAPTWGPAPVNAASVAAGPLQSFKDSRDIGGFSVCKQEQ